DVTRGVDVVDGRLEVGPYLDVTALVGSQAGALQVEVGGLALPSRGVEDDLRGDPLAALEQPQGRALVPLDRGHRLPEAEHDPEVAQVVLQTLGYLCVDEVEEAVAL